MGGGGICGVSPGRGLAEGEESGENGLGCRSGGNVSRDRLSEREEGERSSLTTGFDWRAGVRGAVN